MFRNPHGVHMGTDDTIFLTDDGDHTMRQCTLDGNRRYETQWNNLHRPSLDFHGAEFP